MQIDAALHNMSQGLCMFDAEGRLVVANERYIAMYGLSPDVVKPGCTLLELLEHRRALGTFANDPVEYDAKISGAAWRHERLSVRIELEDGRVVEVVNEPTPDGGWVATHDEITMRVRAEKERARAEHFLHAVVDHIPATVFVKDASDNRYTLLNRAGEDLFGISRDALIGKRSSEVFSADQANAIEGHDKEALAAGDQIVVRELPLKTAKDGIRLVNLKRLAIPDEEGTRLAIFSASPRMSPSASAPKPRSRISRITTCSPDCRTAPPSTNASRRRSSARAAPAKPSP